MMKDILDKLFFQPGPLSHQIIDLEGRPELDGSAVQVLGPSRFIQKKSLLYRVKVMNMHAPFHGEQLLVPPLSLHILVIGNEDSEEDSDEDEDDAAASSAPAETPRCSSAMGDDDDQRSE